MTESRRSERKTEDVYIITNESLDTSKNLAQGIVNDAIRFEKCEEEINESKQQTLVYSNDVSNHCWDSFYSDRVGCI